MISSQNCWSTTSPYVLNKGRVGRRLRFFVNCYLEELSNINIPLSVPSKVYRKVIFSVRLSFCPKGSWDIPHPSSPLCSTQSIMNWGPKPARRGQSYPFYHRIGTHMIENISFPRSSDAAGEHICLFLYVWIEWYTLFVYGCSFQVNTKNKCWHICMAANHLSRPVYTKFVIATVNVSKRK